MCRSVRLKNTHILRLTSYSRYTIARTRVPVLRGKQAMGISRRVRDEDSIDHSLMCQTGPSSDDGV